MTPAGRLAVTLLIALEVIVCFGPAAMLWLLGLLFVPTVILSNPDIEAFVLLAMIVAGAFGIAGVLALLDVLVSERPPRIPTRLIVVFASLGVASLLPLVIGSVGLPGWRLFGVLPLVGAAHLFYLTRSQLLGRTTGNAAP